MEGISPTLALGVLLLGLSGNARDEAANDPATRVDSKSGAGCPALLLAADSSEPAGMESWADAFWSSAASTSLLPDVIDPTWVGPTLPKFESQEPISDVAPAALTHGDPVVRHAVPVGLSGLAADLGIDPCGPER